MKKIVLILLLIFSFQPLFSQIGLKGGINFSTINHRDIDNLSGFQIGLYLHFKLSNVVHLNTGFNYSQKGFIIPKSFLGTPIDGQEVPVNYIEIPANFAFHLKTGQQSSVFIQGGPYFAMTSGNTVESTDYGLNFGLGFEYMTFQIALNYGLGLRQVLSTFQNRVISVTIAGYFEIKNSKEIEIY